ncbi:MAG: right-handed parallel beta-helix repeat-containing protein [Bacteroidota bacterium]
MLKWLLYLTIVLLVQPEMNKQESSKESDSSLDTCYIDPSVAQKSNANGSLKHPYSNWEAVPKRSNMRYRVKRGTHQRLEKPISFSGYKNIRIDTYGNGAPPRIEAVGISHAIDLYNCKEVSVNNLTIVGNEDVISGFRLKGNSSNIQLKNCSIQNTMWGIRLMGNGNVPATRNIRIRNCTINNIADDGIFAQNIHELSIDSCHIEKVNQKYLTIGTSEQEAPGDGIQLINCSNFSIEYCKIDRTDTGNKFAIIANQCKKGVIAHNHIQGPQTTVNGGAAIYMGYTTDSITIAHNQIANSPCALYSHAQTQYIYRNIMHNNENGIWLHNAQNAIILHNTLVNNTISILGKNFQLYNNIIVNGSAQKPLLKLSGPIKSNFNCFYAPSTTQVFNNYISLKAYQLHTGNGNHSIFAEPLFMAPEKNNFELSPGSPCIDKGQTIATPKLQTVPFYGNRPDMGAIEKKR